MKQEGAVVRPFSSRAGVSSRCYSGALQEAMADFGADEPFAKVAEKVRRHYGIEVSVNAARTVTLRHARQIEALSKTPPEKDKPASALIAEMDGSLVPCVKMDAAADDRRKTRKTEWKEVKVCLVRRPEKASPVFAATTAGPNEAGRLLEEAAQKAGLNRKTYVHGV